MAEIVGKEAAKRRTESTRSLKKKSWPDVEPILSYWDECMECALGGVSKGSQVYPYLQLRRLSMSGLV